MEFIVDSTELKKEMIGQGFFYNYQLAKASGVGKDTIGKIIAHQYKPSYIVMAKLAGALNLSPKRAGEIFFKQDLRTK